MRQIIPASGQTLIDIALQELGDAETLFDLALQNSCSITDDFKTGEVVQVTDFELNRKAMVNLFANPANRPASGITVAAEDDGIFGEGIDFWGIELDFMIN